MTNNIRDCIALYVASKTRTFGGGDRDTIEWNPIAAALEDAPLQFAAGVHVRDVVDLVFEAIREIEKLAETQ